MERLCARPISEGRGSSISVNVVAVLSMDKLGKAPRRASRVRQVQEPAMRVEVADWQRMCIFPVQIVFALCSIFLRNSLLRFVVGAPQRRLRVDTGLILSFPFLLCWVTNVQPTSWVGARGQSVFYPRAAGRGHEGCATQQTRPGSSCVALR